MECHLYSLIYDEVLIVNPQTPITREEFKNMNDNILEDWRIIKSVIKICVYGNGKNYFLWNNAPAYYKKLNHLFEDIKSDTPKDYLYPCFITLCSATLEYSLNLIYALYCFRHFEYEDYKSYLETYRNMRFKNKLFMFPYNYIGREIDYQRGFTRDKIFI